MATPDYNAPLEWLAQVREELRELRGAPCLCYCEVDVFDALISELFLTVLATARFGAGPGKDTTIQRLYRQLRERAYHARTKARELATRLIAAPPTTAEYLFWPREWTHTAVLIPVAQALATDGASCRFVVSQPSEARYLHRHDVAPICTYQAWPSQASRGWREGVLRARDLSRSFPKQLPDFGTVSGTLLAMRLKQSLATLYPHVCASAELAKAALAAVQPTTLIVGNDLTSEGNIACQVATKSGILTGVFMHGAISGNPLQSLHSADRIYVYGSVHRDELMAQGIAADRISICGNPYLDGRARQSGKINETLKKRLNLEDGRPWILVATSGPGNRISHQHHQQIVQNLAELSKRLPHIPLVVKLHRKDREMYYRPLLDSLERGPVFVIPNLARGYPSEFLDWLQGCPLMLTGTSTTAIEAMALGVPVISMDFAGDLGTVDFLDAQATIHVRDMDSLERAARQVLTESSLPSDVQSRVNEFLRVTFHALDGRSSARAAEMLRQSFTHNLARDT